MKNVGLKIYVIALLMISSLWAQLRVKNSANVDIVIATQDRRVGIGLTNPSQIIGTFHVDNAKYYDNFWGYESYTTAYLRTNNEGNGQVVERALVAAVPYTDAAPANSKFRKAVTAVVWNQTDNTFPVAGSLASDQTFSGVREFDGLIATVSSSFTFPSGTRTIGCLVDNNRENDESYSIYSKGAAKSYFAGSVGIGTTQPLPMLHIKGSKSMTIPQWGLVADVNTFAEQTQWTDAQQGILIVGLFNTSSSGTTVVSTGARIALQGSLINKNEPTPDNQVSQASIGYQHHDNKEIAGIAADVYDVPTPTGYKTFAGHFHNRKTSTNDYGVYVWSDGMGIYARSGTDAGETPMVLINLPTSPTGLPSGALYRDANNFVKIVP